MKGKAPAARADRIIKFIETYCRVPEGRLVGKPIKLVPFQKRFIRAVFGANRKVRRAYLSIARKNGKSALIAAIALAFIVGPEQRLNSQVVVGARSRDQAAVIYKLADKMLDLNPQLRALARSVPSIKTIIGLRSNVEFRAIAAEGKTAHGLSPILAILDEVGQVSGPHDDFIEAIETAQGAHDDPLLVAISTQARSDGDLFSIWLDDADRRDDPTIVSHVYAADPDMDLDDKRAWKAANPALGIFRSLEDVETQAQRAAALPSFENSFRNLTLNQRVTRFTTLVSPKVWKANGGPVDFSAFTRFPVWGGLDLSMTTDLTAFVLVTRDDVAWVSVDAQGREHHHTGRWHVLPTFWTPESTLEERAKRDRAPYLDWVRDGFLKATPGPAVEYEFVAADMVDIVRGMDLRALAFDRYRIDRLKRELDLADTALPLVEFGQGFVSMGPAVDSTEIEFLHQRVRHGSHPVLTMCAAQAVVVPDPAGNRKLDKSKSTGRIDGMVALTMALGVAMGNSEPGTDLESWLAAQEAAMKSQVKAA